MSASSNCVTCGMFTQLACRRGPEIFWIRLSGLVSTGPYFAKSTVGIEGTPDRARRALAAPARMIFLTNAFTSSSVTRLL